jgi:hypothetical protein
VNDFDVARIGSLLLLFEVGGVEYGVWRVPQYFNVCYWVVDSRQGHNKIYGLCFMPYILAKAPYRLADVLDVFTKIIRLPNLGRRYYVVVPGRIVKLLGQRQ